MIKRRDFIISISILIIAIIFATIIMPILFYVFNVDNLPLLFFVFFVLIQLSNIYKTHKCKCPYCGAGGHLFDISYYWIALGFANKASFICPECNRNIKIM